MFSKVKKLWDEHASFGQDGTAKKIIHLYVGLWVKQVEEYNKEQDKKTKELGEGKGVYLKINLGSPNVIQNLDKCARSLTEAIDATVTYDKYKTIKDDKGKENIREKIAHAIYDESLVKDSKGENQYIAHGIEDDDNYTAYTEGIPRDRPGFAFIDGTFLRTSTLPESLFKADVLKKCITAALDKDETTAYLLKPESTNTLSRKAR